jgi:flagellar assembly protein FliH
MANRIIPKERLSSYKNWEMDAFEQTGPSVSRFGENRQTENTDRKGARGTEHLHEQVERAHQQAKHEGFAVGHEAGYTAGYESGQEAGHNEGYQAGYHAGYAAGGERTAEEVVSLKSLLHAFERELATADQAIGNDLLLLALGLARQMTREALRIKPELVLAAVRECLQQEPIFTQPAQLFLHPEDAALVRQYLSQELDGWTICTDLQLERGGCRAKLSHTHIDATVGMRWQRIMQALGQNGHWLE